MKITFYWTDGTTQDNEFIISNYSYTQCYYNELKPADNYATVSIPFDIATANKLRIYKDDNIKVIIKNDANQSVFTGYVDSGLDFTKTQTLQPITIKLVNQSFLLNQTIGEPLVYKNTSVSIVIKQLLSRLGIVYNGSEVGAVITIVVIKEDDSYYDIIETLLYEYGYVFDFDNNGVFVVMPLFNLPSGTIANTFNGSNIRSAVKETANKREFDYIKVQFSEVSINPNDLVYYDDSEKDVGSHLYFGHESETGTAAIVDSGAVYCEYKSTHGDVIWADVSADNFVIETSPSNAFTIDKTGTFTTDVKTTLGNKGTSYAFRAYNTFSYSAKINIIKAIGTSYTRTAGYEISKNGNLLFEYESKYLQSKAYASTFTKNLANYYRYSPIKLQLNSYVDYPYGSFVTVNEIGIGEITARITKKTYKLNKPIEYELESIVDFTPADITQESSWGNGSTNSSGMGPDITPPNPPTNLQLSLKNDGKVNGTFTQSNERVEDLSSYTVYRKTPDMFYKAVLSLTPDINNFIDESAINGMQYTYKVHATDNNGNVSNPSNEVTIGTVTMDKPYAPTSITANAFNDYITISIVPPSLSQANRDIFTPVEYKIQISKNQGSSYSDVAVVSNTNYDYYFNRQSDGYPEISALNTWRFRVYSVNIYGNVSANAAVCSITTGDYMTWTPGTPTGVKGENTGRTLYLNWNKQSIYGSLVYRVQISKDNVNWYKPNLVDNPYASEDNWKTGSLNEYIEVDTNRFYQVVPLKGQNTDLGKGKYNIQPVTYYYRIAACNNDTGYVTSYTSGISITAQGTSARDILNNSIGWDQIIDQSIKVSKLGVERLIAGEATLELIANDTTLTNPKRDGFQYWALADYYDPNNPNTKLFNKGDFQISSKKGDYVRVSDKGIELKASLLDIGTDLTRAYKNFIVYDTDTSNKDYLNINLVDSSGSVLSNPTISIGNNDNNTINIKGSLDVSNGVTIKGYYLKLTPPPISTPRTLITFSAGSSDPTLTEANLTEGWYLAEVTGAGGGSGGTGISDSQYGGGGGAGGGASSISVASLGINVIAGGGCGGNGSSSNGTSAGDPLPGGEGGAASAMFYVPYPCKCCKVIGFRGFTANEFVGAVQPNNYAGYNGENGHDTSVVLGGGRAQRGRGGHGGGGIYGGISTSDTSDSLYGKGKNNCNTNVGGGSPAGTNGQAYLYKYNV
jgi:hypothetical protein